MASFLSENGFNAVRIPLALTEVLGRQSPSCLDHRARTTLAMCHTIAKRYATVHHAHNHTTEWVSFCHLRAFGPICRPCLDAEVYITNNPELHKKDYLEGLEWFIRMLGEHGLLVLLDIHVEAPGKWPDDGTLASVESLEAAWEKLADIFCSPHEYWNVFAADLKNEVRAASKDATFARAVYPLYMVPFCMVAL